MRKACCGFGSEKKQIPLKEELKEILTLLIKQEHISVFYTDGTGNFAKEFVGCVEEMKQDDPSLQLILVKPYFPRHRDRRTELTEYDETLMPVKADASCYNQAKILRDQWMIEQSAVVIVEGCGRFSRAFALAQYAKNHNKPLVFL